MSLNKVMLIGNVGKDPLVRHNENGGTSANFSLATTERYKDKNGEIKEVTEWHNIVCWRGLAETVEKFVKKGTQLFIEGKLRYREWKDQSGQDRYTTEVFAVSITLLGKRNDQSSGVPYARSEIKPSTTPQKESQEFEIDDSVDDLPF